MTESSLRFSFMSPPVNVRVNDIFGTRASFCQFVLSCKLSTPNEDAFISRFKLVLF